MAINYKVEVDVKDAEKKLNEVSSKFEDAFNAGRAFDGNNLALKRLISETSTYLRQLKKQYEDTVAVLGENAKGSPVLKQLQKDIKTAESELQGLRENLKERRMGSENMFLGISQGAQGLMGAFTAAQGAAAMFGAEQEKLQKIQTKLQASMSILMGLQRLGNALQSTSQFRVQILNRLLEKYHEVNLKVAKSEGAKRLAMMGWIGLIAGAIAGLTALIVKYSKYAEEVKKARELQKQFRQEFAGSAGTQLATLAKLEAGWKATNGSLEEQQKFIAKNKTEFESLGYSVKSVNDAEKLLVQDKQSVIDSILAKARAAARFAQITSLLNEQMKLQSQLEDATLNGWQRLWASAYADRKATWANNAELKSLGLIPQSMTSSEFALLDEEAQKKIYDYFYQKRYDEKLANKNKKTQEEIDKAQTKIDELVDKYISEIANVTDQTGDEQYRKNLAARLEAARKGYESILRLNQDMENRLADARIAAIQNETQREIESLRQQHDKRMQEIQREKEDYIEKLKEQAKLEFLAGNPNADAADFGQNWKPTSEQSQYIQEYFDEMMRLAGVAYDRATDRLYAKMQESKWDYWQKYGTVGSKEKAIIEEYAAKIKEAEESNDIWKSLSLNAEKEEKLWQLHNASRLEYLEQYGSYREKELAIIEKYDHLIENEMDEHQRKTLELQREQELSRLRQQSGGNIIFWDEKQLSRNTLKKALADAEKELNRLRSSGKSTNEEINVMLDRVQKIRAELESANWGTADTSIQSFAGGIVKLFELQKDLENNKKRLKWFGEDEKGYQEYKTLVDQGEDAIARQKENLRNSIPLMAANAFSNTLKEAAESMRQIAEAAGDAKLAKLADTFEGVAQNIDYAAQGAAIGGQTGGGWGAAIGATAAGIVDWIRQIIQASNTATVNEKLAIRYAKAWDDALKDIAIDMQEINYNSIFGDRNLAKGIEGARAATEAITRYTEALRGANEESAKKAREEWNKGNYKTFSNGQKLDVYGRAALANYISQQSGLQNAIITTSQHWLKKDTKQTLNTLYPELFDNGEINIENVKRLLETESLLNNEVNKDLRNQLEELVRLKEAYDDALDAIDDTISATFSSLASDLTDIIWDSVMNGTNAWDEFKKVGSSAITALGKQLLQELLITSYLDQFKERMRNAYMLGDATQAQNEIRSITGEIFNGLSGVFDNISGVAQEWKEWAQQEGFDLTEAAERTAASKAISGVTQESFDDALGRFTAIQSHTYELNETTKALREQQANLLAVTSSILYEVQGIHRDTERMQASLDTIQGDMTIVRSNTSTMNDKGVRMLN